MGNNPILEKATSWLSLSYDETTRVDVQRLIDENGVDLTDSFYTDLDFGTGGLRGIMGVGTNRMNKYTVSMATQGLANYLLRMFPNTEIKVAIAHDSRNNSPFFAQTAANVLSANGIHVYLFSELRPTPELSFAVRHLQCHSGIVITASHNPKEYNGYKVYWQDGGQLVPPHDKNIISEVRKITSIDSVNSNHNSSIIHSIGENVDKAYLNEVKNLSLRNCMPSDLKIVYTPLHGTGITLLPKTLESFGLSNYHIVSEQAVPDGNFPTVHSPNPEESEALTLGLKKAKDVNADILLGTDPDSDRVGIAIPNDKGDFILLNGNQTACVLIYYYLDRFKTLGLLKPNDYVSRTIVKTPLIDRIAAHYAVDLKTCLTGFKWIAEMIRESEGKARYLIGGEESYGYLIGDFVRDKDAIASAALIAEAAAYAKENGKSFYQLLLEVYVKFGFFKEHLVSLTKKGKSGSEEIAAMMDSYRTNPPKKIGGLNIQLIRDYSTGKELNTVSGAYSPILLPSSNVIQFELEDGSLVTARPSGTEPKIKFYFSVKGQLNNASEFINAEKELDAKIKSMVTDLNLI